jgi:phage N-6-adenine-methyltransferase
MSNDTWKTPPEIFSFYDYFCGYDFQLDVCADAVNALCEDYIDQNEDALKVDWLTVSINKMKGKYAWMNPPYSKPLPFVKRAFEQSQLNGIGVVMLLNSDFSTKWGALITEYQCAIVHLTGGRVAFLNENRDPVKGNPKSQIIVIIPPYVRKGQPRTEYMPLQFIMETGATA